MYNDIKTLDQCENQFVHYLNEQILKNQDRNSDWFPPLLCDFRKYLFWTICFSDEKIIAFSAIQKHFFPEDTVRILTRTFFDSSIRLKPGYNLWIETPVTPMAKKQLEWLKNQSHITTVLITMESRHRKDYFSKIINKINVKINSTFTLLENRIQTYPGQPECLFHHAASMKLIR